MQNTLQKRHKVLLVGPCPPPVGGQSMLVQVMQQIQDRAHADYHLFDVGHDRPAPVNRVLLSLGFYVRFCRHLLRCGRRHEVLHIHASMGLPLLEKGFYLLLGRLLSIPVVVHVHGGRLSDDSHPALPFLDSAARWLLGMAHRIIALSDEQDIRLRARFGTGLRTEVIPNPCRYSTFDTTRVPSNGSKRILFVGHLKVEKGVLDLARAIRALNAAPGGDFLLNIVGRGDTEENDRFVRDEVQRMLANDNYRFHGVLDTQALAEVYRGADLFALPSLREDMPLTIIEAMGFGLPVVTTQVGSLPDFFTDGKNGHFVRYGDVGDIGAKIAHILTHPETAAEMGRRNMETVARTFSLDTFAQALKRLYDGLDAPVSPRQRLRKKELPPC